MAVSFLKISSFSSYNSHSLNRRQRADLPPPAAAAANSPSSPSPTKITTKEVLTDLSPLIKVYTDGTVERLLTTPNVPPSPEDPTTGVASKDITISPLISARIYLPKLNQKLPILVYYHGGFFCLGSAFSLLEHRYMNRLSATSAALVIAVEFRQAPEHPLPAAYEDSWEALNWICSHAVDEIEIEKEEWIVNYGDFSRTFIGGDSSGANIAHNLAIQAGSDTLPGNLKIVGAIISHPYFWGSNPVGSEAKENREQSLLYRNWSFVYPSAAGGIDDPLINPFVDGAPDLSWLGCSRILVCLSEKDETAARGKLYAEEVRKSGWRGDVAVVEVEGESHCFHVYNPETDKAMNLIKRIAAFISQ